MTLLMTFVMWCSLTKTMGRVMFVHCNGPWPPAGSSELILFCGSRCCAVGIRVKRDHSNFSCITPPLTPFLDLLQLFKFPILHTLKLSHSYQRCVQLKQAAVFNDEAKINTTCQAQQQQTEWVKSCVNTVESLAAETDPELNGKRTSDPQVIRKQL